MRHDTNPEPPDEITPMVEEITRLYWEENARAIDLCERFGIENYKILLRYIIPMGFPILCRDCGTEFIRMCRSRNDYVSHRWCHRSGPFRGKPSGLCPDCDAIRTRKAEEDRLRDAEERRRKEEAKSFRLRALKAMAYVDYLQSDHWQAKRQEALRRAWFRCQMCNRKGRLHVHHRTYERIGEEEMRDLLVLCERCHREFHDRVRMPG